MTSSVLAPLYYPLFYYYSWCAWISVLLHCLTSDSTMLCCTDEFMIRSCGCIQAQIISAVLDSWFDVLVLFVGLPLCNTNLCCMFSVLNRGVPLATLTKKPQTVILYRMVAVMLVDD